MRIDWLFGISVICTPHIDGRSLSIVDHLTHAQSAKQAYLDNLNDVELTQLTQNAISQFEPSPINPASGGYGLTPAIFDQLAKDCITDGIKRRIKDQVFMALFDDPETGCAHIQSIWDDINPNKDLLTNVTFTTFNGIFNESVYYGIPSQLIENISLWLEPGLSTFHPLLPTDVSYHIFEWLLSHKIMNPDYFDNKCNLDPTFDYFTNIDSTFYTVPECMVGFPKINCSSIDKWNKDFALALQFDIELSFILGVNGGVGIGVELKNYALAELFWSAGGGLSLAGGFALGVQVPFVQDIKFLHGGTFRAGVALDAALWAGAFVMFSSQKFEYIGYGINVGVGIAGPPIVVDFEFVYRNAITQKFVNLTAICESKTIRPSLHPSFRPNNHPTFRPNQHPTHKPINITTRGPNHPTHKPLRPPQKL